MQSQSFLLAMSTYVSFFLKTFPRCLYLDLGRWTLAASRNSGTASLLEVRVVASRIQPLNSKQ